MTSKENDTPCKHKIKYSVCLDKLFFAYPSKILLLVNN